MMNPRELKTEIVELRMTEMEVKEQLVQFLSEVSERKLWKEWGYPTFADFFARELGYDRIETREMLIRLGVILSSRDLESEDPVIQERIEKLKAWRRIRSSREAIAAYRVLTNRSLLSIAETNPKSIEALRSIKGMGEKKCSAYGSEILGAISTVSGASWLRAIGSSPSMSVHSP